VEEVEQALQQVEAEERELVFPTFSNDDALALGLALVERARGRGQALAVDVERSGQLLFHHAMAGTTPDNRVWIERKKRAVLRWHRSSWALGLGNRAKGRTLADLVGAAAADYADHGGCFPVVVRGTGLVGTVTVSGLPQKEDHDLVVEAIRAFLAARRG
jgi:uncharacterized protein (UPF0303 family)